MGRSRILALLTTLLVGCAPMVSGPRPPRPVNPRAVTTTTTGTPLPTTTTTIDPATVLASTCPVAFCLVYAIDSDAKWSDGSPVTSADFAHTVEVFSAAPGDTRPGYELISTVDVIDTNRVRIGFDEPYGSWRRLFDRVLRVGSSPDDISTMETTGPFSWVDRVPADHILLQRKSEWWSESDPWNGLPLGDVNEIRFVFIEDIADMIDALEDGDVDVISVRPEVSTVERLEQADDLEYVLRPGPFWEHIDFHHEDPLLSQHWVRQVFNLAIDREKILDRTVRLLDPQATSLDNTIWMENSLAYESHFTDRFDPAAAETLLIDNGCRPGADGIQVCGDGRMSFVWASTNDDPARQEIFDAVAEDLAAIGVEIVPNFMNPSEFVSADFLFGGPQTWQLINFAWRARPDPVDANPTYYCSRSVLNVNRYCSNEVEALVRSTETIVDAERRAAVYNEADRLYLEDLAVIPLYQKPTLMAWRSGITGPEPNYSLSSDLWNVASWSGQESIVVALPSEPGPVDPVVYDDDAANTVLATLLYGAFGMDPGHRHLPILVESVEMVMGEQ